MYIEILSETKLDGSVDLSRVAYCSRGDVYSMRFFLTDDCKITEFTSYSNDKETLKSECKTVEIDGIIYGWTEYDHDILLPLEESFIVKDRHLTYVREHTDEIQKLLGVETGGKQVD